MFETLPLSSICGCPLSQCPFFVSSDFFLTAIIANAQSSSSLPVFSSDQGQGMSHFAAPIYYGEFVIIPGGTCTFSDIRVALSTHSLQ